MMKLSSLLILLCSIVLLLHSSEVTSHDDEYELFASKGGDFSYNEDSEKRPSNWGEIRPEWGLCSNGASQSPVDLLHERVNVVSDLGALHSSYKPCNATLKKRAHDIMLKWQGDAGYIPIDGINYSIRQVHWHAPSEHQINGQTFDLEAHLVHSGPKGRIAVIGVLYSFGDPDPFLTQILRELSEIDGNEKVMGMVDPRRIQTINTMYYRYIGSLTTPPCTENVLWTIVREVKTVSIEQVQSLLDAVNDEVRGNSRPIQPMNTRPVTLYDPNVEDERD